jgi:hypothetical protein
LREAAGGREAIKIRVLWIAVGNVDRDGHIEIASDLVERIEIRV